MPEYLFEVAGEAPRLDRYIAQLCPNLSRSVAQQLVAEGRVLVNDAPCKASYIPSAGDVIRVLLPEEEEVPAILVARPQPLATVYEDAHMLVLDKAPGMVVHPAPGHLDDTLVNALLAYRPDIVAADVDPQRPGIVHRLDRDTSGLLVIATTRQAQQALQAQFKARQVSKVYLALVYGKLSPPSAAIEAPIGRDPRNRQRRAVLPDGGRAARTEYTVIEHLRACTYLEARPLTGRTHQIRVHFAAIGHPVVGDRTYGYRRQAIDAPRHMLHAWKLELQHPISGEPLAFEAEPPADMQRVLARLRGER